MNQLREENDDILQELAKNKERIKLMEKKEKSLNSTVKELKEDL
jgi:hypothetical protein